MIVIRSGNVFTPDGWRVCDVAVEGSRVAALGEIGPSGNEIDAEGCLVGPAFVDLHCHLRDPGQTWKEDVGSGSAAAVAGGFGAVVAMPNTDPSLDRPWEVISLAERGSEVGLVDVIPAGSLTQRREGRAPSDLAALHDAGVRLFTDDGDCVVDDGVMLEVMRRAVTLPGAVVAQHAEDPARTTGRHLHEGRLSRELGVAGMPAEAEADVVARDLELVARTGARYHCQHVSSRLTVELIAAAKQERLPVTAEVTPHHLAIDEDHITGLDPDFKMYPPLRSAEDRQALVKAATRGIIDAVATDHAPHTPEEKAVGFEEAPRGVIGLETAAAVTWDVLGDSPDRFFEVLSITPARIAGIAGHGLPVEQGGPANLVVFDPETSWVPEEFASKSSNSPFRGRRLRGRVRATVHGGQVVYRLGTVPS